MKLYAVRDGITRCQVAALRNCLSYELAPIDCPVRKCRRDGFCSGPLVAEGGAGRRLARHGAAGIGRGEAFAPVCYLHCPDDRKERVLMAYRAHCRALRATYGASILETTRVIASRRWRRLRGLEGRAPTSKPHDQRTP